MLLLLCFPVTVVVVSHHNTLGFPGAGTGRSLCSWLEVPSTQWVPNKCLSNAGNTSTIYYFLFALRQQRYKCDDAQPEFGYLEALGGHFLHLLRLRKQTLFTGSCLTPRSWMGERSRVAPLTWLSSTCPQRRPIDSKTSGYISSFAQRQCSIQVYAKHCAQCTYWNPGLTTCCLCDSGQITWPLCASVVSSVKCGW